MTVHARALADYRYQRVWNSGLSRLENGGKKTGHLLIQKLGSAREDQILNSPSITANQAIEALLAVPAFLPVTVCTGYVAAWISNLHGFRRCTFIERIFWSIPASIGVSTITAVLIGKCISLTAVAIFFYICASCFIALLCWEWFQLRKPGSQGGLLFGAMSGRSALLILLWIVFAVVSLVDFQKDQRLFMSLTFFDHGARVNWGESILRTGIPPANPAYLSGHPAPLRYYYFWLVDCAAVADMSHLPMRAAVMAGCVWSGFCIAALIGLFLKHFLQVGNRLRAQFLIAIGLLTVAGPYFAIDAWDMLIARTPPPGLEVWPEGQITSWIDDFYFYPHHTVALACCMFGFLLAWFANQMRARSISVLIIGMCFASAFGLSVYVAFAFFLVMIAWSVWQIVVEHAPGPVVNLALGGIVAAILLIPYLKELTQGTSRMHGSSVFAFSVRETIPPAGLLSLPLMNRLAVTHPALASGISKLILIIPGYAIELGFYCIVLVLFLVALRRRDVLLTPPQRALLIIALVSFPFISLIRSEVLNINDFGIHGGMFVQLPLLLLASELVMAWKDPRGLNLPTTPRWLISSAKALAGLGVLSTIYIAFMLRFGILVLPDSPAHSLFHKAWISNLGYARLNTAIARDAVVQFNPSGTETFWKNIDLININRQTAITGDQLWCGSELGGDPSACPAMISAIDPLFHQATAAAAIGVCNAYGIHYLVANVYDPAWRDPNGWVWTLHPVVADPEFRVLDCARQARRP